VKSTSNIVGISLAVVSVVYPGGDFFVVQPRLRNPFLSLKERPLPMAAHYRVSSREVKALYGAFGDGKILPPCAEQFLSPPDDLLMCKNDHNARFILAQITAELLPESETRFFERLSGIPMTFSRDARGKVTRLTAHLFGGECCFAKISDQPPKAPEPPKPRAAIKLDPKLYDACVGQYEFAPDAVFPTGIKLKIWRQGDQLVGQAWGENVLQGAFDIFPESATIFFLTIVGAQLTFIKNDKGEVTSVIIIHREAESSDHEGKRLKNLSE